MAIFDEAQSGLCAFFVSAAGKKRSKTLWPDCVYTCDGTSQFNISFQNKEK